VSSVLVLVLVLLFVLKSHFILLLASFVCSFRRNVRGMEGTNVAVGNFFDSKSAVKMELARWALGQEGKLHRQHKNSATRLEHHCARQITENLRAAAANKAARAAAAAGGPAYVRTPPNVVCLMKHVAKLDRANDHWKVTEDVGHSCKGAAPAARGSRRSAFSTGMLSGGVQGVANRAPWMKANEIGTVAEERFNISEGTLSYSQRFRLRKRALDTKYGSKLWQYRTLVSRLELLALADPDSDIYVKFFADEIEVEVEVELLPSDDDKDGGPKGGTKGGEEEEHQHLGSLGCRQLRRELEKRGLESKGRKAELVERLLQADNLPPPKKKRKTKVKSKSKSSSSSRGITTEK